MENLEKPTLTVPCPVCGQQVSPRAKVCPHCGENLKTTKSEKNWAITLLLCFLLGFVGAHRFYARGPRSGLKMLLLAVGPYIGLLLIILFFHTSFGYGNFSGGASFFFGLMGILWLGFWVLWIVDFFRILFGNFTDSAGYRIQP